MAALLLDWRRTGKVRYLVPSTAPGDPRFDPRRYWLGPVWPHVNWMIAEGLKSVGQSAAARQVVADTLELLEGHGLKEYYNPTASAATTGAGAGREERGLGAGDFGFSSAAYPQLLELARELQVQRSPAAMQPETYAAIYRYVKMSL